MVLHDGRPGATLPASRTRHEGKSPPLPLPRPAAHAGAEPRRLRGRGTTVPASGRWPGWVAASGTGKGKRNEAASAAAAVGGFSRRYARRIIAGWTRRPELRERRFGGARRARFQGEAALRQGFSCRTVYFLVPARPEVRRPCAVSRPRRCGGHWSAADGTDRDTEVFKGGVAANKKVLLSREAAGD